ncbi:tyrosine-type recombinase/integrase [Desulfosediminicola ganghwensis]|uniref:tyrosine-type recombinase/integrase n=1 Tax=Desulfosediminicola ganghwensis TaxID=2569540 RepID=UPI0010AD09F5|nr:tyrosine-type recombinase/integrase [Desulfosediminicola ganghwensis]
MSKLTVLQIKHAKGQCRLADGKGLFFEITISGSKRWLYRYKILGKNGNYIIGHYPEISLQAARQARDEAKKLVQEGVNPAAARREKKLQKIALQHQEKQRRLGKFEILAREWIETQKGRWSENHSLAVLSSLKANVFPYIGGQPIETITPPEVLKIIRRIESRGSLEIAKKVLQRMNSVFRYAVQTGKATYNPAADMKGVLKSRTVTHTPSLLDRELAQLLRDITNNQKLFVATRLALHFTALTACRPGEVRQARWEEFNLDLKEWYIPAERMKMKREHIVPLSKQALSVLERSGKLFGTDGFVFPAPRHLEKPMSDNTMGKALRDMGYKGRATPHGFRASFSTMAYESGEFPPEVIEKALAHEEKNKIKRAYNRAEYLEQRRSLLDWWGEKLQTLENTSEIIDFHRVRRR